MVKLSVISLLAVVSLCLTGCKDENEKAAETLYNAAQENRDEKGYERVIELYKRISLNYPDTEIAGKVNQELPEIEELHQMIISNARNKTDYIMMRISMALDNYNLRFNGYPDTLAVLSKLRKAQSPDLVDDWGRQILYRPFSSRNNNVFDSYALASFGKDGLPGGTGLNEDQLFQNGQEVSEIKFTR